MQFAPNHDRRHHRLQGGVGEPKYVVREIGVGTHRHIPPFTGQWKAGTIHQDTLPTKRLRSHLNRSALRINVPK